ncbi:MAG: MBL fold metallo-hydrolase [Planctomycetes bacterium]|nr:MBL fold metallo-hydrolase [Planctomycetota bacterium]
MLIQNPPVQVTDRLWMLGTNAYPLFLYGGDAGATLFEGGVGAMGPLLLEQLDELGIARDSVKQAVVTHAHPDHVMAVPLFRQAFPGIAVLASAAAAKTLSVEKAVGFFAKIDGMLTQSLLQAGLIAERHRPQPLAAPQIAVDHVLKEGDSVAVGGAAFQVLETPGHSDGDLSFFEPAEKVLVLSDATGYYIPEGYWWPNYFGDYAAYLRSMERLAGLGAEVLCLSHNGVIAGADDATAYLRGAIAATVAYHQRIMADARAGKPAPQIAAELGAEVHARTQLLPLDFFQKNCALLVKQSLKHEGIPQEG